MGKLLALVLVLLAVAAIGFLLYRPGAVIGVSTKSLAHSIQAEADAEEKWICTEGDSEDHFTCEVRDSGSGGSSTYLVITKDAGCWDAIRKEPGPQPVTLEGCITIVDLLRLD